MILLDKLTKAFLIGSVTGIISELVIGGKNHHCVKDFNYKCLLSATIFNIYGWAVVIATLIFFYGNLFRINLFLQLLILLFVIIIFECASGKVSEFINHKKNWHYGRDLIPICDGFVSAVSTFYFLVLIILYRAFIFDSL